MSSILRQITRRYPLNRPRARLLELLPNVTPNGAFATKHGRLAAYPGGEDYICKQAYWFGDFDPWVDRTLQRLTRPGDTAIDVGANIGTTTLCLARSVGVTGRVFSFEPFPANHQMLCANIAANALGNVSVQPWALSDRNGVATMLGSEGQAGQAHMDGTASGWHGASQGSAIEVGTTTFDAWVKDQQLDTVAVCKVDVEGFEESVFRGMRETLRKCTVKAFLFERHVSLQPIVDMLDGYQIFRIDKGLRSVRYSPLGSRPAGSPSHDFVAVLPEAMPRIAPWVAPR